VLKNTNDFFFIKIYILKSLKKANRVSLAETDWKELTDNSGDGSTVIQQSRKTVITKNFAIATASLGPARQTSKKQPDIENPDTEQLIPKMNTDQLIPEFDQLIPKFEFDTEEMIAQFTLYNHKKFRLRGNTVEGNQGAQQQHSASMLKHIVDTEDTDATQSQMKDCWDTTTTNEVDVYHLVTNLGPNYFEALYVQEELGFIEHGSENLCKTWHSFPYGGIIMEGLSLQHRIDSSPSPGPPKVLQDFDRVMNKRLIAYVLGLEDIYKVTQNDFLKLLRANVPIASQLLGLFFETVLAIPSTRATIIKYVLTEADLEVQRSCGRGPLLAIKQFNVEKILRRLSNTVQCDSGNSIDKLGVVQSMFISLIQHHFMNLKMNPVVFFKLPFLMLSILIFDPSVLNLDHPKEVSNIQQQYINMLGRYIGELVPLGDNTTSMVIQFINQIKQLCKTMLPLLQAGISRYSLAQSMCKLEGSGSGSGS